MAKSFFETLVMGVAKAADKAMKEAARERAREVQAYEKAKHLAVVKSERQRTKAENARIKALERERAAEAKRQISNGHNMRSI